MRLHQQTFEELRRSRRDDPITSQDAARSARGLAAEHERIIMRVMRGGGDWTAHEVAEASGLSSVQVCRRWAQLRDNGLIEATINTRPTPSGRAAQCYVSLERGGNQ